MSIFGTLLLAGMWVAPVMENRIETRTWLGVSVLIAVLTFIFVAGSYSPSVYIERGPPASRTGIISQFIFILGYGLIAFFSGAYFQQYVHWEGLKQILLVMLISCYIYGARSVVFSTEKISLYSERAAVWDERDLQIQQSREQGILEINVRGIDGLPVGGIRDFADTHGPGFWVNKCAARYYRVDAIYATLP